MTTSALADDPEVTRQRLSRVQYEAMVDAGVLDGEPVQLVEGELVRLPPQSWAHARGIDLIALRLARRLSAAYGDRYLVRQEKPLAVTADSEPEPDVAVVDTAVLHGRAHPS